MRIAQLGLIITILSANAAHLDAASYFVNYAGGSDGNVGRNQAQAWKHCPGDPVATGQAAQAALAPGDTVFFKGGVSYVFTGASGIELKWSGDPKRAITYDGNRSGLWGTGRAHFTDNYGAKAIAAFSATGLRHDLVFSFLEISGLGGASALPVDLGQPVAPRGGSGISFSGGAENVSIVGCVFREIGFWFNQKPMAANSLAGSGFSSTKCRDVTLSNCDFSRVARACDLGNASELSNLTIVGCSFRDSILWPVYLPAGMGSVPSSAIALSESTFAVDQQFNSAAWGGYGENPFRETMAVAAGEVVILAAVATASPAATFQWSKNGVAIVGASNVSLDLGAVAFANSGTYKVVATNAAGSATSNVAVLTVGVPPAGSNPPPSGGAIAPAITQQPAGQTVNAGASVTLSVAASGAPAPTIKWYRNGVTFGPSWTGPSLALGSLSSNDAGSYVAVATNAAGSATSNMAVLTVGAPPAGSNPPPSGGAIAPAITQQPAGQTVNAGASVTLSVAASGAPAPSITWYRNGVTYGPPWKGPTLALGSLSSNDAGSYVAVASNSAGTVTSNPAIVTVRQPPSGPSSSLAISELPPITILSRLSLEEPTATVDFTVVGSAPKRILIRAIGPTLDALGVSNFLPEAVLTLFQGETLLGHNEGWDGNAEIAAAEFQLGMFPFANVSSRDAALLVTLSTGSYRVVASGGGASTGMVLIEISELP